MVFLLEPRLLSRVADMADTDERTSHLHHFFFLDVDFLSLDLTQTILLLFCCDKVFTKDASVIYLFSHTSLIASFTRFPFILLTVRRHFRELAFLLSFSHLLYITNRAANLNSNEQFGMHVTIILTS